MKLLLRHATPGDDIKFITSAWTLGAHQAKPASLIPWEIYQANQTKRIETLLQTERTLVLCFPSETTELAGFLCYRLVSPEVLLIHWMYLKDVARNQGHVRQLLQQLAPELKEIVLTQYCRSFAQLRSKLEANGVLLTYDPYFKA